MPCPAADGARGLAWAWTRGYVNRDLAGQQARARRVPVLLDRLLRHALIEARSCERFKLLSEE